MRRIFIDGTIRQMAKDFRTDLCNSSYGRITPLSGLIRLKNILADANQIDYVEAIISNWDDLIIAEPDTYITEWEPLFDSIIPKAQIETATYETTETDNQGNTQKVTHTFYKSVVAAMRYDYVQDTVYPKYMSKLHIKTCVYCNAQYAISVEGYINYELDHALPKSKYPYLCTTFMNLQPSCSRCNKSKSNKEEDATRTLFRLYTTKQNDIDPMQLRLDSASLAKNLSDPKQKLSINFSCINDTKLEKGQNEFFHIKKLYQAHTDVAEEIVWKSRVYDSIALDNYKKTFTKLGFTESQFRRFILGNYAEKEDVHMRPLAKLIQDIAKQLKFKI